MGPVWARLGREMLGWLARELERQGTVLRREKCKKQN